MEAPTRKPTLVYLDVMGIGWPIHCLLCLAGVDYDFLGLSLIECSAKAPDGRFGSSQRYRVPLRGAKAKSPCLSGPYAEVGTVSTTPGTSKRKRPTA